MQMNVSAKDLALLIEAYPPKQRWALAVMQDMQNRFGYIPREGMVAAASYLGTSMARLYSMATFYKALSLKPKGRHIIKLCDGTACHIRGSSTLLDGVERLLGIKPGGVTADGLFSLETVNCLGACAMAPVMLIDDKVYGAMTPEKIPVILLTYREEAAE
jgi:NADH:ubiquinone oxidoreductase subunit E